MSGSLAKLRVRHATELSRIAELVDRATFAHRVLDHRPLVQIRKAGLSAVIGEKLPLLLEGTLLTYLLHCESRAAAFLGKGFYTIGPCGEELLGSIALNLRDSDLSAMHYRHLATSIVRQLQEGKTAESIALDRSRGYTCSSLDPVTGGKHCCLGGGKGEFLVTSTLSSQAPPAVGRALAIPFARRIIGDDANFRSDAVSYVSVGDGSIDNAHFLSAINLAKYADHFRVKCPLVFAVTDNQKCISLKGGEWVNKVLHENGNLLNYVQADGSDAADVYEKSRQAIEYSRSRSKPSLLLVSNLPRRFGHAATDRQIAYMTEEEIQSERTREPLADCFREAVQSGALSEKEFLSMFDRLKGFVEEAFNIASEEPKITSRDYLVTMNSAPIPRTKGTQRKVLLSADGTGKLHREVAAAGRDVMRKQMTRVLDECMERDPAVVYIGEDVEHGGYYLVTDGLAAKYGARVRDFPPDETALIGIGMGYSQAGLLPIVEIPYAKYLDCAFDMFQEAAIMHWLSDGKQANGMVLRLQGFDKGVFGGNFHTHNSLPSAPGVDVVCFSNGADYARGMRCALRMAKLGRVVMLVDSTDLLNRRHLSAQDENWMWPYPEEGSEGGADMSNYSFDDITVYAAESTASACLSTLSNSSTTLEGCLESEHTSENTAGLPERVHKQVVIVTYGNGVPTALLAREEILRRYDSACPEERIAITVVDSPYLTSPPEQLRRFLQANVTGSHSASISSPSTSPHPSCSSYSSSSVHVLFADVCKQASMPLAQIAVQLAGDGDLGAYTWRVVGAAPTYNPLGNTITFLSVDDICAGVDKLFSTPKDGS